MSKLHLSISEKIQGEFVAQELNLMIVFQVNCPGCIASALPLIQNIYSSPDNKLGIVGLSTAFQHYDKNNSENTRKLVEDGHLVGHSLEIMEQHGHHKLPYKITFPIIMDAKMQPNQEHEVAQAILKQHEGYQELGESEKNAPIARVVAQLKKQSDLSISFTVNQFRGSPSFVLFDKDYEIVEQWFGHTSQDDITERVMRASK